VEEDEEYVILVDQEEDSGFGAMPGKKKKKP